MTLEDAAPVILLALAGLFFVPWKRPAWMRSRRKVFVVAVALVVAFCWGLYLWTCAR